MQPQEFVRLANNFYNSKGLESHAERINTDVELWNYINGKQEDLKKKYKVAFVYICLNPLYWEFAPEMVTGAKNLFLPGHDTDFFFWTDIPEKDEEVTQKMRDAFKAIGVNTDDHNMFFQDIDVNGKRMNLNNIVQSVIGLRKTPGVTIFPTESVEWPMPTLMRYHLFLQQEEKLKEYDYIFYCDVDMLFQNVIGDEILGSGLTAAPHPGYYLKKELYPPYEPNEFSEAYIPRPGRVIREEGAKDASGKVVNQRFRPEYYAGGFQGGKAPLFISAMKEMKAMIDRELSQHRIPIWNDESIWNAYLFKNTPSVYLTPSYIMPDSLIKEFYEGIWGRSFQPKLITITKWFSISKEGGEAVKNMIQK